MLKRLIRRIRCALTGRGKAGIDAPTEESRVLAEGKSAEGMKDALAANAGNAAVPAKEEPEREQDEAAEQGRKYRRPRRRKKKEIEDWDSAAFDVPPMEGKTRFHDFSLPDSIMRGICDMGFSYCTPIQAETMAKTLGGEDAIGQAQTGTGKTAAFLITIFSRLLRHPLEGDRPAGRPRALVLAPTRELVSQITKDANALGKYADFSVAPVFGGMDYRKQQDMVEAGPVDLVVATPGRLIDFIRQGIVKLDAVEIMVIDEADRMLDMGFIPDVRRIVGHTPASGKRQTLMFSATLTQDVRRLAYQWCTKPTTVEVDPEQVAVDTVRQVTYMTTTDEKYAVLYNLITLKKLERVMIFTNRRDETRVLYERLKANGVNCAMLSGDVAQEKRMKTLERFRNGEITVLVATDVAGRGIHIEGVSHVINYTLPQEAENYVHRIGRTGRAGSLGTSISFATEEDAFYLPEIEKYIGRKLECVYPDDELLAEPPPAPKSSTDGHVRKQGGRDGGPRRQRSGPPRGGPPRRR